MGGSSSTNGEAYFRGSASIFDRWESLGNPGWNWRDVYPLFIEVGSNRTYRAQADPKVDRARRGLLPQTTTMITPHTILQPTQKVQSP